MEKEEGRRRRMKEEGSGRREERSMARPVMDPCWYPTVQYKLCSISY